MSEPIAQAPNASMYYEPAFKMQAAKILPGEYFVSGENIVLMTLLGSCVAACIRDPQLGLGGMNHFLLPDLKSGDLDSTDSARYGAFAMEVLINQLAKMGARRNRLEAKVFGGANVLRGLTERHVGQRNTEFVIEFLKTEGIPVIAQDLGGVFARKVAFFPATGEVRVKRLKDMVDGALLETEQRYQRQVSDRPIAGDIELFD